MKGCARRKIEKQQEILRQRRDFWRAYLHFFIFSLV